MEQQLPGDVLNWIIMIVVGGIAGAIAARIMKGTSFGLIINTLLGIAGGVVGGFIFGLLKINAGAGIVKIVEKQFSVTLPENVIGMMISATVGAILILLITSKLGIGKNRRRGGPFD